MTHETAPDGLCLHCGMPVCRPDLPPICEIAGHAAKAKRALGALGLEYVSYELRGRYALYRSVDTPGLCERLHQGQIDRVIQLADVGAKFEQLKELATEQLTPCDVNRNWCCQHQQSTPCPVQELADWLDGEL